jgi:hypothetical protein
MPKGLQAIYTQVSTGSNSSFTFNNIPQNYTDLRVVLSVKDVTTVGTGSYVLCYINNDSGSTSYSRCELYQSFTDYGTGVVGARGDLGYLAIARTATSNTSYWNAGTFSTVTIDFTDYTSGKWKSWQQQVSAPSNLTTAYCTKQEAGIYKSSAPITKLAFNQPGNYVAGSSITLYGIAR